MVVTFAQLRDAQPRQWGEAATDWAAEARRAADRADDIRARGIGPVDRHWADRIGDQARTTMVSLADRFEVAADVMNGVEMVLVGLQYSISAAQNLLRATTEEAQRSGLVVGEDGALLAGPGRPVESAQIHALRGQLDEALRQADQADRQASAELRRLAAAVTVTDPDRAVNEVQVSASDAEMAMLAGAIPVGADPRTVHAWWAALTDEQRRQFQLAEPTVLAGLDGIPDEVKRALHGSGKYDRMALVQFALDHWNDTAIDKFDNNCANFVSSAMLAAGVQEKNDGWGTFGSGNWVEGAQTGWAWLDAHDYSHSASWARADELHDFLTENGSSEIPLRDVEPGDLIFFDQEAPNPGIQPGVIHHTAVVTAVTPDGDIHYTQHTNDQRNLSLTGRTPHEAISEGNQRVVAVRISPDWY